MTTNSLYDIEYKQDDVDTAGTTLQDDDGLLDLTGKTVTLIMKKVDADTPRYEIPCTPGGTVNGVYYSAARGGVTTSFSKVQTAVPDEYEGEFVVVGENFERRIPSGNNHKKIMIWEKL
ncbi:MAG: hypothetical protein PHW84_02015 [Methanosarcina sp.]|nr:hypothetical protein [Methanosarcina sp.]